MRGLIRLGGREERISIAVEVLRRIGECSSSFRHWNSRLDSSREGGKVQHLHRVSFLQVFNFLY